MSSETIVAVFDASEHANAAARELETAGVPTTAVKRYTKATMARQQEDVAIGKHRSLWSWLLGEETPNQDYTIYDRAIERGEEVLTVVTDQRDAARVVSILERHSPIDLDEKGATGIPRSTSASLTAGSEDTLPLASVQTDENATGVPGNAAPAKAEGEQVVPLAEEKLDIGKRTVERGTTRLRRYVVERPVEEQIRLRDETVSVERRPVTGSATVAPDAFTEKVVEVTETREEPVVGKVARVVEEVAVGKKATERVETVRDTVRKEEVDVDRPTDKPMSKSQGVSSGTNTE